MGHQAALVRPLTETETLPTEYSNSVSTRLFFLTLDLYDVVRSVTVPTPCFGKTLSVHV